METSMAGDSSRATIAAQLAPLVAPVSARDSSLQRIYHTAPIGLAFLSPDCRYLQINQRLTEICGISVEGHLGRTVRECVPGLADAVEEIVRTIIATGEPVTGIEVAGQRADQPEQRSWVTYWHPIHGPDDKVIGINVAAEEITERKRAETALRASEQQFRMLANAIPQLVWMSDAEGGVFWFNDMLGDFGSLPAEEIVGRDWLALHAPDDARVQWLRCLETGMPFEMELELRGKDGVERPFLTRAVPLREGNGAVYRWIGTHVDISEQREREEHVQFVVNELAHRTKNLLTVVMAIGRQTARHAKDVDHFQDRFSERLVALAHSHDLLVHYSWKGASFHDLIATQLRPFGEIDQKRIRASGPPLLLKPNAVQYLGLAFHELATNASKHGALSAPDGEVAITWLLEADTVRLYWRESGGPAVVPSQRRGFGHVVIHNIVPRALSGAGALDFPREGVVWAFEFPDAECENA
jgi:PAS domain S-box-containing protein